MGDLTRILDDAGRGDPKAAEELLPLVYEELRKLAAQRMAHEPPGHTLQPTALVHEVWLRLSGDAPQQWANRRHFFGAAAEAMRRILIEHARRKQALRRGGGLKACDLDEVELAAPGSDEEVLAVHEALQKLEARDEEAAEIVKLRYFVGLTIEEAAAELGVSAPTANRRWAYARAWLYNELAGKPPGVH